jgi:hypothetical protein
MAFSWLSGGDDVAELIAKRNYSRAEKVLRGQLAKDPSNASVRQQLADVLSLDGKTRDAVELLWKLADDYATSGFVGKAIAVLKKVQRLDPSLTKVEEKLARLVRQKDDESNRSYSIRAGAMRRRFELEAAPTPAPATPAERPAASGPASPFVVDFEAESEDVTPPETAGESAPRSLHPLGEEAALGMVASPLFSDFSSDELVEVIKGLELLTYEAGDVIVAEGAPGDSLFVLTTGTVKAFVKDPDGHYHKVREMYEGAFFGEVSILTGKPRSATITAATQCEVLTLDRAALEAISERQPNVMTILRHFCEARYGSADEQQIRRGDTNPGTVRAHGPD